MNVTAEQRRVARLLGIQNIDSQNDLNQINRAVEGARSAGIQSLDSELIGIDILKEVEIYKDTLFSNHIICNLSYQPQIT